MKHLILTLALLSFIPTIVLAQKGPLFGSGTIVGKSYPFIDFDKISIEDFDGKIEIEIGEKYSINIEIDDNLAPLLSVSKDDEDKKLVLYLSTNKNGRLYLENTNIKIKITLPLLKEMNHSGNTRANIAGLFGKSFKLNNQGNGNVFLDGDIEELEIKKTGNGAINASKLICKKANVKSFGNGNVLVNAQISLSASGSGNGSVLQFGNGRIDPLSGIIGNGNVRMM